MWKLPKHWHLDYPTPRPERCVLFIRIHMAQRSWAPVTWCSLEHKEFKSQRSGSSGGAFHWDQMWRLQCNRLQQLLFTEGEQEKERDRDASSADHPSLGLCLYTALGWLSPVIKVHVSSPLPLNWVQSLLKSTQRPRPLCMLSHSLLLSPLSLLSPSLCVFDFTCSQVCTPQEPCTHVSSASLFLSSLFLHHLPCFFFWGLVPGKINQSRSLALSLASALTWSSLGCREQIFKAELNPWSACMLRGDVELIQSERMNTTLPYQFSMPLQ